MYRVRVLSIALSISFAVQAQAQTAPAAEDDLEVPAAIPPAPSANAPTEAKTPAAPAPSVAAVSSAVPAAAAANTAPAPAAKPSPTPSPERPHGLSIGGYLQAEYDSNRASEDQLDSTLAPRNFDRFFLRRARLRVDQDWEFASATLELDANTVRGPVVGIRRADATVLYRGDRSDGLPMIALSAGIIDLPFGYEVVESARNRLFLERSTGSLALFPAEMDAGAKLWGALGFLRYAVAVTNGEPVDARGFPRDPNQAKDVSARFGVDVKATPSFSVSGGTSFVVGKGFHAGRAGTKNSVVWRDDNENSVLDTGELVAVPGSAPEPSKNFDRWVLGLDLEAALVTRVGRSKLVLEGFVASNYDRGLYVADPVAHADLREAGLSATFTQSLFRHGLLGFRYSDYNPNSDLFEQRRGNFQPRSAAVRTFSPLVGFELKGARLIVEYDIVRDKLGRDSRGVPSDADNNLLGVRLQVEL